MQGGGVSIYDAEVTFDKCEVHHNTASYVRACFLELSWYFLRTPPIEEIARNSLLDDRISCDCISSDDLAVGECLLC